MKTFFKQFTKAGWERYKLSPAANIELVPKQDSEMHEPYNEEQTALIIGKILEKRDILVTAVHLPNTLYVCPARS